MTAFFGDGMEVVDDGAAGHRGKHQTASPTANIAHAMHASSATAYGVHA